MTTDELRALAEGQDKETLIEFLVEEMKAGTSVDVHLHIAFSDDWFDEDRYASKQRWMALVLANSITVDEDGERVLNTFAERALADFYQEVAIATAFGRLKEAVALLLIADEEISALVDYGVDPIPLQEEVDDRFLAITDIAVGEQRTELFQHLLESRLPGEYPLRLALRLADTDEQRRALRARVEHDPDGEEIAFELLLIDGEREEQEAFLFERDVSPVRWARAAIDALESKEWERVLSYCREGEKRFPSWSVWDQLRLRAYIGSGDRKEARALAFTMVVEERLEYQILRPWCRMRSGMRRWSCCACTWRCRARRAPPCWRQKKSMSTCSCRCNRISTSSMSIGSIFAMSTLSKPSCSWQGAALKWWTARAHARSLCNWRSCWVPSSASGGGLRQRMSSMICWIAIRRSGCSRRSSGG